MKVKISIEGISCGDEIYQPADMFRAFLAGDGEKIELDNPDVEEPLYSMLDDDGNYYQLRVDTDGSVHEIEFDEYDQGE